MKLFIGIGILVTFLACSAPSVSTTDSRKDSPKDSLAWRESMRELSETLSYALPELHKDPHPSQVPLMKKLAGELQRLAHGLESGASLPSPDPSAKYVGIHFADEIQRIQTALDRGQPEPARRQLLRVSHYCYSCHTQRPGATSPNAFLLRSAEIESWSEIEKGDFFAAIRDFEDSQIHYQQALADQKWARLHPDQWAIAFQKDLGIVLRVMRDASAAIVLVDRLALGKGYPSVLAPYARAWRKQLEEFRSRKERRVDSDSAEQFVARARGHLRAGRSHLGSLVQDFLAILELQSAFALNPAGPVLAEALYWHGVASQRLWRLGFPDSAGDYWQACRDLPDGGEWRARCRQALRGGISGVGR